LQYRAYRTETYTSQCQVCNPTDNAAGWSILPGYLSVSGVEPPNDCINITDSPTKSPVTKATQSPIVAMPIQPIGSDGAVVSNNVPSSSPMISGDKLYLVPTAMILSILIALV
jgi:hypothetical protein